VLIGKSIVNSSPIPGHLPLKLPPPIPGNPPSKKKLMSYMFFFQKFLEKNKRLLNKKTRD
jgi:hypothetical protein